MCVLHFAFLLRPASYPYHHQPALSIFILLPQLMFPPPPSPTHHSLPTPSLAHLHLLLLLVTATTTVVTGFTLLSARPHSSSFSPKHPPAFHCSQLRPSSPSLLPLDRRLHASSRPPSPFSPSSPPPPPWPFLLLSSAAILVSYADRANLATCILPMAQELHWSLPSQGLVLSSFFVGYGLTGLLGGYLADRFGGSKVLQAGIFLWSTFTLLTPLFAQAGVSTAVLARVLLGLGEGVAFPAIHAMIPLRVPGAGSRSLAVSLITAASYLGAVLAFALSPLLIEQAGWPSVFYFFGALPLLWFPLWWLYGGEEGGEVKGDSIGAVEGWKEGGTEGRKNEESSSRSEACLPDALVPYPPPSTSSPPSSLPPSSPSSGLSWAEAKYLLGRKEVQAILVAQYTQAWGIYGLLSWLPSYYNKVGREG